MKSQTAAAASPRHVFFPLKTSLFTSSFSMNKTRLGERRREVWDAVASLLPAVDKPRHSLTLPQCNTAHLLCPEHFNEILANPEA